MIKNYTTMNNVKLQNNLILTLLFSIIGSALLAHTMLVPVAIIGGWLIGMAVGTFHKYKTKEPEYKAMSFYKVGLLDTITALVGSQMGWVALLI